MTGKVTSINPDIGIRPAGFIETPSSQAILLALRRARARQRLTMIAGAPGVGKSEALRQFRHEAPDMIIVKIIAGEGGGGALPVAFAMRLSFQKPMGVTWRGRAQELLKQSVSMDFWL